MGFIRIRFFTGITIAFLFVTAMIPGVIMASRGTTEHTQFRGDNTNQGVGPEDGLPTSEWVWNFKTDGGIESSPAVMGEQVFFGSKDGNIYCLDTLSGKDLWTFETDGDISCSPLLSGDKIYIGSGDKKLYCLKTDYGIEQWTFETQGGVVSSPKIYKGNIYFGSNDGNIYCIDTAGKLVWNYSISGEPNDVWASPAIANDFLYIGDSSGTLVCLDAVTGDFYYDITVDGDIYTTCCLVEDDLIFASGIGRKVYRYNGLTGQKVWEFSTPTDIYTSAAYENGVVYISDYEYVYALPYDDPSGDGEITPGEVIWKHEIENFEGGSSPIIVGDRLVIGVEYEALCLFKANGTLDWSFETSNTIVSSPVYVGDRLYITCNDRFIYCLEGQSTAASPEEVTEDDEPQDLYLHITIPIIIFIIVDIAVLVILILVWKKRKAAKQETPEETKDA